MQRGQKKIGVVQLQLQVPKGRPKRSLKTSQKGFGSHTYLGGPYWRTIYEVRERNNIYYKYFCGYFWYS